MALGAPRHERRHRGVAHPDLLRALPVPMAAPPVERVCAAVWTTTDPVEKPMELLVYAVGELHKDQGYDHGWIIDATGKNYNTIFWVAAVFLSVAIGCMWFVTRGEAREV